MGRLHGSVARDEPPVCQKVGVAGDEALAEPVGAAPLGQHLPPVVLERGAARRVVTKVLGANGARKSRPHVDLFVTAALALAAAATMRIAATQLEPAKRAAD